MKKLLFISLAFLTLSALGCSQKVVPENVKKEFTQKFADAKSVKWNSEEANEWEAEFKLNGKEMTASFESSGKWLETETEISAKDLPPTVANVIKTTFAGYKTDEICILDSPDLKGYEVGLKKGETSVEAVFDNTGKILKKTDVTEEEKEEKEEK
jgi:hypothetical protein